MKMSREKDRADRTNDRSMVCKWVYQEHRLLCKWLNDWRKFLKTLNRHNSYGVEEDGETKKRKMERNKKNRKAIRIGTNKYVANYLSDSWNLFH